MGATEKILAAVEQARKESQKAMNTFQSRQREIESMSSRTLDFFGDSFTSDLSEIAIAVRKANEGLYTSLQAQVVWLDATCRPLLKQKPSTRAVKEVTEMLRWLNEESEISTNFTGSINGSARSDLVNVSYSPSLVSQTIQKYWQSTYSALPDAEQENFAWRQREQKKKQEEQEREAEARRARYEYEAKQEEERRQRHAKNASATKERREYLRAARQMIGGSLYAFAWVKSDGTASAVSKFFVSRGGTPGDVSKFRDMKAIVATNEGIVGLRRNGTCQATDAGKSWGCLREVHRWTGIVDLAAGDEHVVGLKEDGRCVAISVTTDPVIKHYMGQSDVQEWRDIKQIACGSDFTVGLRKDGTIAYAGDAVAISAKSWKNITLIGAGCYGVVGIDQSGKIHSAGRIVTTGIQQAENVIQIEIANGCAYVLQADGIVRGGNVRRYELMAGEDVVGKNIIAIAAGEGLLMLTEDGRLIRPKGYISCCSIEPPSTEKLFSSYREYCQEMQERELRRQLQEQLMEQRRAAGTCQYCGGTFKKGMFGMNCSACGRVKDYSSRSMEVSSDPYKSDWEEPTRPKEEPVSFVQAINCFFDSIPSWGAPLAGLAGVIAAFAVVFMRLPYVRFYDDGDMYFYIFKTLAGVLIAEFALIYILGRIKYKNKKRNESNTDKDKK